MEEATNIILNGFQEIKAVWKQLGQLLKLRRYLIAFFVIQHGGTNHNAYCCLFW